MMSHLPIISRSKISGKKLVQVIISSVLHTAITNFQLLVEKWKVAFSSLKNVKQVAIVLPGHCTDENFCSILSKEKKGTD